MAGTIAELTDDSFSTSVASGVSLVEFYGTWCPPCKLLEPVVEEVAEKYSGKAFIGKLNVDDNAESAVEQSIADIPTIIFFRDGVEQARLFGAQGYETLAGELDRLLLG